MKLDALREVLHKEIDEAVAKALERLAICSECQAVFISKIKPGRHEVMYCEDHRIIGDRRRKREWAQRQRVVATCSTCGAQYLAQRRPSEGQNNYCADCKHAATREQKRIWAAKSRAKSQSEVSQ